MCKDSIFRPTARIRRHELTQVHQHSLSLFEVEQLENDQTTNLDKITDNDMIEDGLRNLLHALAGNTNGQHRQTASRSPSPPGTLIDWNLYNVNEDTNLAPSAEQQRVASIAQDLLDRLDNLSVSSADDEVERSDDEHSADEPIVTSTFHFHLKNYSCRLMTAPFSL